jgi:hypothetical protein
MTDTTLMSVTTSCASDPTDLDRLAASLEALALTFGHSETKQNTTPRGEEQRQYVDGVALAT